MAINNQYQCQKCQFEFTNKDGGTRNGFIESYYCKDCESIEFYSEISSATINKIPENYIFEEPRFKKYFLDALLLSYEDEHKQEEIYLKYNNSIHKNTLDIRNEKFQGLPEPMRIKRDEYIKDLEQYQAQPSEDELETIYQKKIDQLNRQHFSGECKKCHRKNMIRIKREKCPKCENKNLKLLGKGTIC